MCYLRDLLVKRDVLEKMRSQMPRHTSQLTLRVHEIDDIINRVVV